MSVNKGHEEGSEWIVSVVEEQEGGSELLMSVTERR